MGALREGERRRREIVAARFLVNTVLSPIEGLDLGYIGLTARVLVYALARMEIDCHFSQWRASEPPPQAMQNSLRLVQNIGQAMSMLLLSEIRGNNLR